MPDISLQLPASDKTPAAQSTNDVLTAAKGGGITFAGTLFEYGVRFVIGILLARFLGAHQYGMYNLALTALTIAGALALLGLKPAMVRYVSLFSAKQDPAGVWGIIQLGLILPVISSLVIAGGLYLLAEPIAENLFDEPDLVPLLKLAALGIPFLALSDVVASATRGFKKMQYTVISQNIVLSICKIVLIVLVMVIVGLSAMWAVAIHILAIGLSFVLLIYFLNKLFSLKRPFNTARREVKELLTFSLPVYLSDIISTFSNDIRIILLGTLGTVTSVGIFAAASQINLVGVVFHRSIVTSSMPIISELYGRDEKQQLGHFYQTITKWTFTVNLPLFLLLLLFPATILSVFGESFLTGTTALIILAFANLVNSGTGICGVIINMTGYTRLKLLNTIIVTALAIVLSIVLIPRWGIVGAAIASLGTVAISNLIRLLQVFILFRLLPYNMSFFKPIVAGLGTLVISWFVSQILPPETNLFLGVINMVLLIVIFSGLILLLGLSEEDRLILNRLRQRTKHILVKNQSTNRHLR